MLRDACAKDFMATASMRGIGWVVCYEELESGTFVNTWINEHDVGHLAGCNPVLVCDVFEHAFMIDYGLKRVDYLIASSIMSNGTWWSSAWRRPSPI